MTKKVETSGKPFVFVPSGAQTNITNKPAQPPRIMYKPMGDMSKPEDKRSSEDVVNPCLKDGASENFVIPITAFRKKKS